MKRSTELLLLVILVSVAGFVAPRPASACSCVQLDPTSALAEYPAAFTGTLVDVSRPVGGFVSGDADAVYRFEVDGWVKGDLGDVVDVHSAADGAACGIEVGVGNRAGVFLRAEGDTLSSSLCETIDPDVLLAGLKPLVVGAPGPGVLLVSGSIGGFNYVVLNESGGIVAGVNGPGVEPFDRPWQFADCPGGKTLVEQWGRWLIVRDLSDLSMIRQIDLQNYADTTSFTATRCMAQDGSSILLAGEEWTGNRSVSRLFNVSESVDPTMELPPGQVYLGEEFAVVQDYESGEVKVVDYDTGEDKVIHVVEREASDDIYVSISTVAISPDSKAIAVSEVRYDPSNGSKSTLVLYEADGTKLATVELEGEVHWLYWLDSDRLAANRSIDDGRSSSSTIYATPSLSVEIQLDGWQGYNTVVSDGVAYAVDGGSIVSADLETGEVEQIATLPTQDAGPIAVLPADFQVATDLVASPEANTPNTVPPLISDAFGGSDSADVTGIARIILAVLLSGGIIAFVLARKRREVAD